MCAAAYGIQHALAAARRCGRRFSLPVLPGSPRRQRIALAWRPSSHLTADTSSADGRTWRVVGGVAQALLEVFRDAVVVYDEGGSDAAVFAVLFVVVDLDYGDAAPARKRDRVTVADRAACVSDDRYFSTG